MKTVKKTSVFPAPKEKVFHLLQRLDTLQYIAMLDHELKRDR